MKTVSFINLQNNLTDGNTLPTGTGSNGMIIIIVFPPRKQFVERQAPIAELSFVFRTGKLV